MRRLTTLVGLAVCTISGCTCGEGVNELAKGFGATAQRFGQKLKESEKKAVAAFERADKLIQSEGDETIHGNSDEAKELARRLVSSLETAGATKAKAKQSKRRRRRRRPRAKKPPVRVAYHVFCQLNERRRQVAFLVHVPKLEELEPAPRNSLLEVAFKQAAALAVERIEDTALDHYRVTVALRGARGYEAIATGTTVGDELSGPPRMRYGEAADPKLLHGEFFPPLFGKAGKADRAGQGA